MDIFGQCMERIKMATGEKTQVGIAKILGIRQSSISDAKKRGAIPTSWLIGLYTYRKINPDWILGKSEYPFLKEDTNSEGKLYDVGFIKPPDQEPQQPQKTATDIITELETTLGESLMVVILKKGQSIHIG